MVAEGRPEMGEQGISLNGGSNSAVGVARPNSQRRAVTYCLVPRDLGPKLDDALHNLFGDDPSVGVLVERRRGERRARERRATAARGPRAERRRLRNSGGRRVGERRADLVPIPAPELPAAILEYADELVFAKRVPPSRAELQEVEAARLVLRYQAGEDDAFELIHGHYFERVHAYLTRAVCDDHLAEDLAQEVFSAVHAALPRYEVRNGTPFRAWLFRIAHDKQITHLRRREPLEFRDPFGLAKFREQLEANEHAAGQADPRDPDLLDWVRDERLARWLARLPEAQRRVLTLRYSLGFEPAEIASVFGRSPAAVRMLEHRALRFLRERLKKSGQAVGLEGEIG